MLVLTRKHHESVVVGDSDGLGHMLTVTVLRVRGGEVRLGFEGPAQIAVQRLEVWESNRCGVLPSINDSSGSTPRGTTPRYQEAASPEHDA